MNNRINKLAPFALMIAAVWVMAQTAATSTAQISAVAPITGTQLAHLAESDRTQMTSRVWHHRPASFVGAKVLALYDEPGIAGWMPFLQSAHIMQKNADGEWELVPERMATRITLFADDIRRAGFLMLDCEAPLTDHENVAIFIEALANTRATLTELGLSSTAVGYFRIPDHVRTNAANRFAFTPVLRHTDAVFIMVKGPGDRWDEYLADVVQVAPNHRPVWFMDAYSRIDGQPFSQERILDMVRLAHRHFRNPQIVFRQSGPHVAQASKWVLEWLGFVEEQTP